MHHALEEMRPRRVAYRYVRTWFAVDLVCSIPLQLISFSINEKLDSSFSLLRLLKLVRLSKVQRQPSPRVRPRASDPARLTHA